MKEEEFDWYADRVDQLESEKKELIKALEFYARQKHLDFLRPNIRACSFCSGKIKDIIMQSEFYLAENGELARETLKKIKEE